MQTTPTGQRIAGFVRGTRRAVLLVSVALLAACGGGGGGGADASGARTSAGEPLSVSFVYGGNALLFRTSTLAPEISGLNGRAPSCSLRSGTLPPGMRLNGDCTVSGTPTQAGAFPITVQLGAEGFSNRQDYEAAVVVLGPSVVYSLPSRLVVGAGVSAPTLNNFWTPTATDTVHYSVLGTLPPGLSIDPVTGRIHGTPSTAGSWQFKVQVETTSAGHVAREVQQFPNFLEASLPSIFYRDTSAWAGIPFGTAPELPDGGASWRFSAASLPAGLSIDPLTGVISGTPLEPALGTEYPIHVTSTGTDGASFSTDFRVNLSVTSPVYILYLRGPGRAGVPYSDRPSVINNYTNNFGGFLALSYSYALHPDSSLLPGLTLNPVTGEISGTPDGSGSRNFTVDVTVTLNGVSFVVPALGSMSVLP